MNTTRLPHIDVDACRERAHDLRRQALNDSLEGLIAAAQALLHSGWRSHASPSRAKPRPAHCAA